MGRWEEGRALRWSQYIFPIRAYASDPLCSLSRTLFSILLMISMSLLIFYLVVETRPHMAPYGKITERWKIVEVGFDQKFPPSLNTTIKARRNRSAWGRQGSCTACEHVDSIRGVNNRPPYDDSHGLRGDRRREFGASSEPWSWSCLVAEMSDYRDHGSSRFPPRSERGRGIR